MVIYVHSPISDPVQSTYLNIVISCLALLCGDRSTNITGFDFDIKYHPFNYCLILGHAFEGLINLSRDEGFYNKV